MLKTIFCVLLMVITISTWGQNDDNYNTRQLPAYVDYLAPGCKLAIGESLASDNGQSQLTMQVNGELALFNVSDGRQTWSSMTMGSPATYALMQNDGNLVLYNNQQLVIWSSNTAGNPGAYLVIDNNGKMYLYYNNASIWSTENFTWGNQPRGYMPPAGTPQPYRQERNQPPVVPPVNLLPTKPMPKYDTVVKAKENIVPKEDQQLKDKLAKEQQQKEALQKELDLKDKKLKELQMAADSAKHRQDSIMAQHTKDSISNIKPTKLTPKEQNEKALKDKKEKERLLKEKALKEKQLKAQQLKDKQLKNKKPPKNGTNMNVTNSAKTEVPGK